MSYTVDNELVELNYSLKKKGKPLKIKWQDSKSVALRNICKLKLLRKTLYMERHLRMCKNGLAYC